MLCNLPPDHHNGQTEMMKQGLPPQIAAEVDAAVLDWSGAGKIARLWNHDKTLWTNADEDKWLGMGGSSLCPEVLSLTFALYILDSTDPAQVKAIETFADPKNPLHRFQQIRRYARTQYLQAGPCSRHARKTRP